MALLMATRPVKFATVRLSTRRLLHTVLVPSKKGTRDYMEILQYSALNPLVSKVIFDTTLFHEDVVPNTKRGDIADAELSQECQEVIANVGRFKNLQSVELKYHSMCAAPDSCLGWPMDYNRSLGAYSPETTEFRTEVLGALMKAMNDKRHPASGVRSLAIENLQDISPKAVTQYDDFKEVFSHLDSLALHIATESHGVSPEASLELPEPHVFYDTELKDQWLRPVSPHLEELALYGDDFWGYWPRCDLRSLHFPKLKSLSLGNLTFTHDWQLDWILSHADTLEELRLDHCPIVQGIRIGGGLDAENYPKDLEKVWHCDELWFYERRWHELLLRIKTGLPKLKHFGMGSGSPDGSFSTPSFEKRHNLKAEIVPTRYCFYDRGTLPTPWIPPEVPPSHPDEEYESGYHTDNAGNIDPRATYPDCEEQDKMALEALMAETARR